MSNDWFSGKANIRTYMLEELMATKLRALYQRAKGRDLYDLWMSIDKLNVDCGKILTAFQQYCSKQNTKISRAEFEKNLFVKIKSNDFLSDVKRVLPGHHTWDPMRAYHDAIAVLR